MPVRAVFFDAGETLFDETRFWAGWADWMGVPRLTLFAALGAVIARGERHQRAFELVRPGFDLRREWAERLATGKADFFGWEDLHPDVLPCLAALRAQGYRVGMAGNQSTAMEHSLRELGLPLDLVISSASLKAEKPSPEFFTRLAEAAGVALQESAYVGDRVDNDVVPAASVGMLAVFIRRGPWGYLQANRPELAKAGIRLDSLSELPDRLRHY